jgi:hypothetical protein
MNSTVSQGPFICKKKSDLHTTSYITWLVPLILFLALITLISLVLFCCLKKREITVKPQIVAKTATIAVDAVKDKEAF